jgi:hypothetical protein
MFKTILDGEASVLPSFWAIHGLQEKVVEVKVFKACRIGTCLGEDQLQFMTRA